MTAGAWTALGLGGALAVLVLVAWLVLARSRSSIVDWRDAEHRTATWLRSIGCRDVTLTADGADGGIDILTDRWAVQVKHRSARVGRPAVQQIVGAALAVERSPVVVSTSGFTGPALEFAADHDVALVELELDGRARPVNEPARALGRRRIRFLG